MTYDVFDPTQHKIVAVDKDGGHIHVSLNELKTDMGAEPAAREPAETVATDRLALAVALASHAVLCGVQAGDYRWHGGSSDFEWQGIRMDAPSLIEHAKTLL